MAYNGTDYTLAKVGASDGGDEEPAGGIVGTYNAVDGWENTITVVITDTTITFTPVGPGAMEIVWTYELDGDLITLYSNGEAITNPLAGYMEVSNGVAVAMAYNGTDYTLAKA